MSIEIIDTLKPTGPFPAVLASDVGETPNALLMRQGERVVVGATPQAIARTAAVSSAALDAILPQINLFDRRALVADTIVNQVTGVVEPFGFSWSTARLPVLAGESYVTNIPTSSDATPRFVFIDAMGSPILPTLAHQIGVAFVAPAGAVSIVISVPVDTDLAAAMFVQGDTIPGQYQPFRTVDGIAQQQAEALLAQASEGIAAAIVTARDLAADDLASVNLLSPAKVRPQSIVSPDTGHVGPFGYGWSVATIPVVAGVEYITDVPPAPDNSASEGRAAFVDCFGEPILPTLVHQAGVPFTAPARATALALSITPEDRVENLMFVEGSVLPAARAKPATVTGALLRERAWQREVLPTVNLFNPAAVLPGSIVEYETGNIVPFGYGWKVAQIRVESGKRYVTNLPLAGDTYDGKGRAAFLDALGNTMAPNFYHQAGVPFTAPFGATSLDIAVDPGVNPSTAMFVEGEALPPDYVPFQTVETVVRRLMQGGGDEPTLGIGFFGNSQTAAHGYQDAAVATANGIEAFSHGFPGHDFAALATVDFDASFPDKASLKGAKMLWVTEGHNEWAGQARPLGEVTDAAGTNTTCGWMRQILERALALDPMLIVGFTGITFRGVFSYEDVDGRHSMGPDTVPNAVGVTGPQMDAKIRQFAEYWGCPFADLRSIGISALTDLNNAADTGKKTHTADGLHWLAATAVRVGCVIGAVTKKIFGR
jgi:hypothetical protein